MLRSMGRAPGDVAVDGGAEKVCEPRLPKLPPRPARASASVIANASTAATAQSASSGRTRKESMKSSQKDRLVPPKYWYPLAALEEVPHGVAAPPHGACGPIPLVPARHHVASCNNGDCACGFPPVCGRGSKTRLTLLVSCPRRRRRARPWAGRARAVLRRG